MRKYLYRLKKMNRDILGIIALKLDYKNILNFCLTEKRIYKSIYENNNFWRKKLYKEYQLNKNLGYFYSQLFVNIQIEKVNCRKPKFICNKISEFLFNTDFENCTEIPLNYVLFLSKGVFKHTKAIFLHIDKEKCCCSVEMTSFHKTIIRLTK